MTLPAPHPLHRELFLPSDMDNVLLPLGRLLPHLDGPNSPSPTERSLHLPVSGTAQAGCALPGVLSQPAHFLLMLSPFLLLVSSSLPPSLSSFYSSFILRQDFMVQVGLEFRIFLPLLRECWKYGRALPGLPGLPADICFVLLQFP